MLPWGKIVPRPCALAQRTSGPVPTIYPAQHVNTTLTDSRVYPRREPCALQRASSRVSSRIRRHGTAAAGPIRLERLALRIPVSGAAPVRGHSSQQPLRSASPGVSRCSPRHTGNLLAGRRDARAHPRTRCPRADRQKKLIDRLKGTRVPFTPGRLVAELNFGFWTYLFDSEYGYVSPKSPGLWPRLIDQVFPNMPDAQALPRRRGDLASRFADIVQLRNRAFHHEPIWKDPDLHRKHAMVVETIDWMNPAVARALLEFDRFDWMWQESTARYLRRSVREVAKR